MDNSTSVREAAVELLGRFVLSRPQLTEQYYDMLIERILVRLCTLHCLLFCSSLLKQSSLSSGHGYQREEESDQDPARHLFGAAQLQ